MFVKDNIFISILKSYCENVRGRIFKPLQELEVFFQYPLDVHSLFKLH